MDIYEELKIMKGFCSAMIFHLNAAEEENDKEAIIVHLDCMEEINKNIAALNPLSRITYKPVKFLVREGVGDFHKIKDKCIKLGVV